MSIIDPRDPRDDAVPLGAAARVWLDVPEVLHIVAEGTADVFAVEHAGDGTPGQRRLIGTVAEGDMLFAAGPSLFGIRLIAIGTVATRFIALPLDAAMSHPTMQYDMHAALETWVRLVSRTIERFVLPRPHSDPALKAGEVVSLAPSQRVSPAAPLVFVAADGDFVWADSVTVTGGLAPFPLDRGSWVFSLGETTARVLTVAEVARQGAIEAALASFHDAALEALAVNLGLARADELNRQRSRGERDRRLVSAALARAAAVARRGTAGSGAADAEADDGLSGAVAAVARHLGAAPPVAQLSAEGLSSDEQLLDILRLSHLRSRRVRLEGRWWRNASLPAVTFDEDGAPLALLPRGDRYLAFDPRKNRARPVNARLARKIAGTAHAVYATLPQDRASGWSLAALGLAGARSDVTRLMVYSLLAALVGLLTPYVTGRILNDAVPYSDTSVIVQLSGILAAVAIAVALIRFLQGAALLRVESRLEARAQPALWDRVLRLPAAFVRRYSTGDLAQRIMGLSQIRSILSKGVVQSVLSGVFASANLAMMVLYGGWLALAGLGVVIVMVLAVGAANILQARRLKRAIGTQGEVSGLANQAIGAMAKLRVAGAGDRAVARLLTDQARYRGALYAARTAEAFVRTLAAAAPAFATLVFILALEFLYTDFLAAGDFVAFNVAFGSFLGGVLGMLTSITTAMIALTHYERLQPILAERPERVETALPPGRLTGRIEIDNVTFRYTSFGPLVLKGVTIRAEPGEFVAIVGESGSGKSTLLRLLLGFEEPQSGTVLYDGRDLSKLDLAAVRAQLGVVLQSTRALGGSILDNIVGSRTLSIEEAWEAAEKVGLAGDISAMPMEMHTLVGDGGTLSGGQRQRLMLARAIASRPNILLLDEATSALDNRTQATVTESLARLSLTRLVIAHRLSTIRDADRIYVLSDGAVIEEGRFDDLVSAGGAFAALVARQRLE